MALRMMKTPFETSTDTQVCKVSTEAGAAERMSVALLTGGADRPYAFGLAKSLMSKGVFLEIVGNDELDCSELQDESQSRFLNLRGDQDPRVSPLAKVLRVLKYYLRLIRYAKAARPRLFHILWNNKFEHFDRTILMLYYRILGKIIVLTVHNVNSCIRDGRDSALNRVTLRIQYRLAHHMFVHTDSMKRDLIAEYRAREEHITVIPFGINNSVPDTALTSKEAKHRLGIRGAEKTILFFGNIAPYKGLEYLISAFRDLSAQDREYRLIIAGRPKNCDKYWSTICDQIKEVREGSILLNADFIPDQDTELYFKAADVLVLPYRYIYQSGVLFLGYNFGLPVIASDAGSLKEDICEDKTGFVFRREDAGDLARAIQCYFSSDLYANLEDRRKLIRGFAAARNSWDAVAEITRSNYAKLVHREKTVSSHRSPSQDVGSAA